MEERNLELQRELERERGTVQQLHAATRELQDKNSLLHAELEECRGSQQDLAQQLESSLSAECEVKTMLEDAHLELRHTFTEQRQLVGRIAQLEARCSAQVEAEPVEVVTPTAAPPEMAPESHPVTEDDLIAIAERRLRGAQQRDESVRQMPLSEAKPEVLRNIVKEWESI